MPAELSPAERRADFPEIALILGGARSGKSALAERLAGRAATVAERAQVYVATAESGDDEMAARIARHRARRGPDWRTVAAPVALPESIRAERRVDHVVLIDCLTLWLSNLMLAGADVDAETERLLAALAETSGPAILVSNEVGLGIVPANAQARRFRDAQGALNQRLAARAELVLLVAAGLPVALKGAMPEGL